jgi:hypothetical protein
MTDNTRLTTTQNTELLEHAAQTKALSRLTRGCTAEWTETYGIEDWLCHPVTYLFILYLPTIFMNSGYTASNEMVVNYELETIRKQAVVA